MLRTTASKVPAAVLLFSIAKLALGFNCSGVLPMKTCVVVPPTPVN